MDSMFLKLWQAPTGQNFCQSLKLHFCLEVISVSFTCDNQSTDTNGFVFQEYRCMLICKR